MPRIPYADEKNLTPQFRELLDSRRPLNLYRMLPRTGPKISAGFIALGGAILRDGRLDPILREIAILRVGVLSKASYEVHQHTRIARKLGMSEGVLAGISEGPSAKAFSPKEALVMRYTDETMANVKASDALFREAVDTLGEDETAELTIVVGFYMMVCRFLENFEIPVEAA